MAAAMTMLLAGCGARQSPNTEPRPTAGAPSARQHGPMTPDAAHAGTAAMDGQFPVVSVWDGKILLDGALVGDATALERMHKLQRVDGLFDGLKRIRDLWKVEHADAMFPGVVWLAMDRTAEPLLVKSIFQTAAHAGYSHMRFVVRTGMGTEGHLKVNAIGIDKLGWTGLVDNDSRVMVLEVRRNGQTITWRRQDETLSKVEAQARTDLAPKIASEWAKHGNHRKADDAWTDSAIVYVEDDVDYATTIAAFDAVAATMRPGANGSPAFDVFFSTSPKSVPGDPLRRVGRLEPSVIQGVVRKNFGNFHACYGHGLEKNPNLSGSVSVHFVIERDGSVSNVRENDPATGTEALGLDTKDATPTLTDRTVVACIVHEYEKLRFPPPKDGIVTVVYPLIFRLADP